jgi:hypothetical protein
MPAGARDCSAVHVALSLEGLIGTYTDDKLIELDASHDWLAIRPSRLL